MAKFLLSYSSGIESETVEAPDGIDAYIAARFGHVNEYLKLGGNAPQLLETPQPVMEEMIVEEPGGGSPEPVEEPAAGASTDEHGASQE